MNLLYLKSILTKRTISYFVLIFMLLVITYTFNKSILIWAYITGFITYLYDAEFHLSQKMLTRTNLRKSILFLLLSITFFSIKDVYWNNAEWLKSYVDAGTILFIIFLIISHFIKMNRRIFILSTLFILILIPIFVVTQLPILADSYAVFAFLLIFFLIMKEVIEVRKL